MNNLQLIGNTDKKLKEIEISGYSGYNLAFPSTNRSPYSFLLQNNHWKVFVLYRPADINHHLPQDSLGIVIKKNEIDFSIADGVSIVNSTHDNQSGLVSLELVKESLSKKTPDYKALWEKQKNNQVKGASTLQHGRITSTEIVIDCFGETNDLGETCYLDSSNKIINLSMNGYDFFPQSLKPKQTVRENIEVKGFVSTSDGVILTEDQLYKLFNSLKTKPEKVEIDKDVLNLLPNSPDDQSIIMSTKLDS